MARAGVIWRLGVGLGLVALAVGAYFGFWAIRRASAVVQEGIARIPCRESLHLRIPVRGSFTEIGYWLSVESGPNVDIYFFRPSPFSLYPDRRPAKGVGDLWFEDTRNQQGSPYPPEGVYDLVTDNTDLGKARPESGLACPRIRLRKVPP